jgi:hypothetical protein
MTLAALMVRLRAALVLAILACVSFAHADPPRRVPRPTSPALAELLRTTGRARAGLARALARQRPGRVARVHLRAVRMDAADGVGAICAALLEPDPDDEAWYARLTTGAPDRAAFDTRDEHQVYTGAASPLPAMPEGASVDALIAAVMGSAAVTSGEVRVHRASCGWGDVSGATYQGIFLEDVARHEVVWLAVHERWDEE